MTCANFRIDVYIVLHPVSIRNSPRHKEHASKCSGLEEEAIADTWSRVGIQFRNDNMNHICSMYGIYTHMWLKFMGRGIGKYSICLVKL